MSDELNEEQKKALIAGVLAGIGLTGLTFAALVKAAVERISNSDSS